MCGWLLGRVLTQDGGPKRPRKACHSSKMPSAIAPQARMRSRAGRLAARPWPCSNATTKPSPRSARRSRTAAVTDPRVINPSVIRASLAVTADMQRQVGHLRNAVEYARLAAGLADHGDVQQAMLFIQPLAQLEALLAEELYSESDAPPRMTANPPQKPEDG